MSGIAPERALGPLVLTLDIGTSSTRALLFDRLARPLAAEPVLAGEPVGELRG